MRKTYKSTSPDETKAIGRRLSARLSPGSTVCLYGDLGAGKTVFVKGMASALGIDEADVTSASFTIIVEYASTPPLYHIDLYRLGAGADMEATGIYEAMGGDGIAVIEWAEHLQPEDAEGCLKVWINLVTETAREIIIEGDAEDRADMQA